VESIRSTQDHLKRLLSVMESLETQLV